MIKILESQIRPKNQLYDGIYALTRMLLGRTDFITKKLVCLPPRWAVAQANCKDVKLLRSLQLRANAGLLVFRTILTVSNFNNFSSISTALTCKNRMIPRLQEICRRFVPFDLKHIYSCSSTKLTKIHIFLRTSKYKRIFTQIKLGFTSKRC